MIWKNRSGYHTHAWIAIEAAEIASMVSTCDIDVAPGCISNGDPSPAERATTVCHVDFRYGVVHALVYTTDTRDVLNVTCKHRHRVGIGSTHRNSTQSRLRWLR